MPRPRRLSRGRGLRRLLASAACVPPFQSPSQSYTLPSRFSLHGLFTPQPWLLHIPPSRRLSPISEHVNASVPSPPSGGPELVSVCPLDPWGTPQWQARSVCLLPAWRPRQTGFGGEWKAFLFFFFLSLERPEPPGHRRTPLPPGFQTMVLCPRLLLTLRPGLWHWLAGPPVARLRLLSVPPPPRCKTWHRLLLAGALGNSAPPLLALISYPLILPTPLRCLTTRLGPPPIQAQASRPTQ